MSALTPIHAALAAFAIADRERQAEIAGREYGLHDSRAVAERFGVEATQLALVARAEMFTSEEATLEAVRTIRQARGDTA